MLFKRSVALVYCNNNEPGKVNDMAGTSVKKLVAIATVSTLLLTFPVEMTGISDTASAWIPVASVAQAAPVVPSGRDDPGLELRRQREAAERERVLRQMEEDRKKREQGVQDKTQQAPAQPEEEVRFRLAGVTSDPSEIVTPAMIQEFAAAYIGKEVSITELTELVQKINDVYAEKGYVTCKAYLPLQTIENGTVHIGIIEGKTGDISLSGNKHTRESYIRNRLPLLSGNIQNFNELNGALYRFNATNDAQLGITMKAGKAPGTTDYDITVREPKNDIFTFLVDNTGSTSTGQWREGIYYSNRSLSGRRDSITVGFVRSEGLKSGSFNYTVPVGRSGGKLSLDYSTSSNKLTANDMKDWHSKGHGWYLGASYLQPLIVNSTTRTEAKIGVYRQNSQTDMFYGTVKWLDSRANNLYASFAMTSYGKSHAFYHQHYLGFGHANAYRANTGDYANKDYALYRLNSFYQKSWKNGHVLSGRLGLQWRGARNLPSAEQFFLGGMNSVRGYKQDTIGGDSGFLFSAEYAVPLDKKRAMSLYGFFDYGNLWGSTLYDDRELMSLGLGFKGNVCRQVYMNLAVGFPLERDVNGNRVSKARVHFAMNAQF